jgi:hypothetical protein
MRAMPGSPLKRQRKVGIRADDGSVIAFPYMPRAAELDPLRLSLRMQVWRIVFMIGMRAMLEGKLDRGGERSAALEALSPALRARLRDRAAPET